MKIITLLVLLLSANVFALDANLPIEKMVGSKLIVVNKIKVKAAKDLLTFHRWGIDQNLSQFTDFLDVAEKDGSLCVVRLNKKFNGKKQTIPKKSEYTVVDATTISNKTYGDIGVQLIVENSESGIIYAIYCQNRSTEKRVVPGILGIPMNAAFIKYAPVTVGDFVTAFNKVFGSTYIKID